MKTHNGHGARTYGLAMAAGGLLALTFYGCGPGGEGGGEENNGGGGRPEACGASVPFEQVCGQRGQADDACVGSKDLDFSTNFGPQTFIPDTPGAYAYAVSFDEFDGLAFWELEQGLFEIARGDSSNTWEGVSGPTDPGKEFTMRISRGGEGSDVTSARLSITQVSYGSRANPWPIEPGEEHCHSVGLYGKANYLGSSQSIYVFTAPAAGDYVAAIYDIASATPMELERRDVGVGEEPVDALSGAADELVRSSDSQAELTMTLGEGDRVVLIVSNKSPNVGGNDQIGFDPYTLMVKTAQ